jgi:hypothetical protein
MQHSEEDSLDALNAINASINSFSEVVGALEGESEDGRVTERLEAVAACCAANSAKLRFHSLPTAHVHLTEAAKEFVSFYDDYARLSTDWVLLIQKDEKRKPHGDLLSQGIGIVMDVFARDPFRGLREIQAQGSDASDMLADLQQRSKILWSRFDALIEVYDKRVDRLLREHGWTLEDKKA